MKAMLCQKLGHPSQMELKEIDDLTPGTNEVVVDVKACSVNYPDTLMVQGLYQFKPPLPFSPGSDISGVIRSVGEAVTSLKPGDAVFGIAQYGGFAEQIVMHRSSVFPKPPAFEHKVAASFMMAYGTSYHALKDRARLKEGDKLVVLGASGGVGLAAVEIGKLMGAHVIAAASTEEKLELCRSYGADDTINYSKEDLKTKIKELTNGNGANVVFDPVGGPYTEAALRATAWDGRLLILGFPAGIANIPMNLPLLKGNQIVGVFWGNFTRKFPEKNMANAMQLINWIGEGKLKPHIGKVYSLEDSRQALIDMMERRVMGKIIIEP